MMNVQHADISEYMALKDKIQYSVDLLLKCEEMALRMAFIWLFLVGKTLRFSITLHYRLE